MPLWMALFTTIGLLGSAQADEYAYTPTAQDRAEMRACRTAGSSVGSCAVKVAANHLADLSEFVEQWAEGNTALNRPNPYIPKSIVMANMALSALSYCGLETWRGNPPPSSQQAADNCMREKGIRLATRSQARCAG